nr:unnamed protein product [Digitaria exilis]
MPDGIPAVSLLRSLSTRHGSPHCAG